MIISALTKLGLEAPAAVKDAFAIREVVGSYVHEADAAEHRLGADIAAGRLTAGTASSAVQSAAAARLLRGAV